MFRTCWHGWTRNQLHSFLLPHFHHHHHQLLHHLLLLHLDSSVVCLLLNSPLQRIRHCLMFGCCTATRVGLYDHDSKHSYCFEWYCCVEQACSFVHYILVCIKYQCFHCFCGGQNNQLKPINTMMASAMSSGGLKPSASAGAASGASAGSRQWSSSSSGAAAARSTSATSSTTK